MVAHSTEPPHLEFEGATLAVGEVVASAVAEELEGAMSISDVDRAQAGAVARELRLWGFMASVCDPRDREERESLVERLERLGARAYELLPAFTAVAGAPAEASIDRRFVMRIVDIHGDGGLSFEDEMTDVKRAKWERNTNRALSPIAGTPSPSSRPPPGLSSAAAGLAAWAIKNEETPPV